MCHIAFRPATYLTDLNPSVLSWKCNYTCIGCSLFQFQQPPSAARRAITQAAAAVIFYSFYYKPVQIFHHP